MIISSIGVRFTDSSISALSAATEELSSRNCSCVVITIAKVDRQYEVGFGLDFKPAENAIHDNVGGFEIWYYAEKNVVRDIAEGYVVDLSATDGSFAISSPIIT